MCMDVHLVSSAQLGELIVHSKECSSLVHMFL